MRHKIYDQIPLSLAYSNSMSISRREKSISTVGLALCLAMLLGSSIAAKAGTCAPSLPVALAFPGQRAADRIRNDFLALSRRQTSRHILLPRSQEAALALKQKLRNRVDGGGEFVVDTFAAAARRYSLDAQTKEQGGLLGELVPQGYVSSAPELDRACFEAPLGEVFGPIESDYGFHLLLVCERTGCPKLDGPFTRVVRRQDGRTALAPPAVQKTAQDEVGEFVLDQVPFWIGTALAGGILAELAARAAGVVDTLSIEDRIDFFE